MILLIDNYDSFAYNLYQMIGEINSDIKVVRNDKISVAEIEKISPEKIILSPGPGRPENAGIILDVVKNLGGKIPILGVCLGHQAICMAFGANITYAKKFANKKIFSQIVRKNFGSGVIIHWLLKIFPIAWKLLQKLLIMKLWL